MDGGAATVVDAFLDAGATLLVPTFGGSRHAVTAPPYLRPPRNGISYDGWTDQGGLVALAGVGLTCMTLLHYAEQVAGRVLLRRWARVGGEVVMVAVGGCSDGFEQFAGALAAVETFVTVGRSHWRVFLAAAVVDIASAVIRRDPGSTRCPRADCEQCADKILGGPLLAS